MLGWESSPGLEHGESDGHRPYALDEVEQQRGYQKRHAAILAQSVASTRIGLEQGLCQIVLR